MCPPLAVRTASHLRCCSAQLRPRHPRIRPLVPLSRHQVPQPQPLFLCALCHCPPFPAPPPSRMYLVENGWTKFITWYDYESWYPIGRPIGKSIYPGMQVAAAVIHWFHRLSPLSQRRVRSVHIIKLLSCLSRLSTHGITQLRLRPRLLLRYFRYIILQPTPKPNKVFSPHLHIPLRHG